MEEAKLQHNPNFADLELEKNAEIRFFCEAFSLLDAVNNSNLLLAFSRHVNESKDGKIEWVQIPDLFPPGTTSASYISSIARVGELIDKVVRKGWITPMRTKSLSTLAAEAYHYHKTDSKAYFQTGGAKNNIKSSTKKSSSAIKQEKCLSESWKEMSQKLTEIAEFQDKNMNYHKDFQKENYLPHPDSWKVYTGTFAIIFITLLYAIIL